MFQCPLSHFYFSFSTLTAQPWHFPSIRFQPNLDSKRNIFWVLGQQNFQQKFINASWKDVWLTWVMSDCHPSYRCRVEEQMGMQWERSSSLRKSAPSWYISVHVDVNMYTQTDVLTLVYALSEMIQHCITQAVPLQARPGWSASVNYHETWHSYFGASSIF